MDDADNNITLYFSAPARGVCTHKARILSHIQLLKGGAPPARSWH